MSITFKCACGKTLSVADEKAGKKARCPGCKEIIEIPATNGASKPASIQKPQAGKPAAIAKGKPSSDVQADTPKVKKQPAKDQDAEAAQPKKKAKKSKKVLLIVLGLAALLVGGGCLGCAGLAFIPYFLGHGFFFSSSLFGGSGIDQQLKYVPDNCTSIHSTRVSRIRSSALYKDIEKDINSARGNVKNPLYEKLGISEEDIERETNASGPDGFVIIITTNKALDAAAFAKKGNYKESKVGNYTLYDDKGQMAYAVPESKVFLQGSAKTLEAVLKRDKKPELSEGLKKAMDLVDFSNCHASASDFSAKGSGVFTLDKDMDAQGTEWDMSSGMSGKSISVFKDASTAEAKKKEMEEMVKKFREKDDIGKVSVDVSGNKVVTTFSATADEIKKKIKGSKGSGGGGMFGLPF